MIMFGVGQTPLRWSSVGARRRAAEHEAEAEQALGTDAASPRSPADGPHALRTMSRPPAASRAHRPSRGRGAGRSRSPALAIAADGLADPLRPTRGVWCAWTPTSSPTARASTLPGDGSTRCSVVTCSPSAWRASDNRAGDRRAGTRAAIDKAHASRPELRASVALRDARREEADARASEAVILRSASQRSTSPTGLAARLRCERD